jgi:putative flavoprotein involved in K+ transport
VPEAADGVGQVRGPGSGTTEDPGPWEGEQRSRWKPTQQQALGSHGGDLHRSRHYSLCLALRLTTRQEGTPMPATACRRVHHTS